MDTYSFLVPEGTNLHVKEGEIQGSKKLVLKNNFVEIEFYFRQLGGGAIGAGPLGMLAGLSGAESQRYWYANFLIKIVATFNPYRTGHPKMRLYHEWVDQIFDEFKHYFDSNYQWEKTLEMYYFYRDKPSLTKEQIMKNAENERKEYMDWLKNQPHKSQNN